MLRHLALLLTIGLASLAFADGPGHIAVPATGAGPPAASALTRTDPFYSQPQTYAISMNASTTHGSEVVDDIPTEFVGMSIGRVRVFVAEWMALWQNPQALIVNFYDGQCPPPTEATAMYLIPWADLDVVLVYDHFSPTVYMVDAVIDPPFVIESPTSMGVLSMIGWPQQPWTGVCMTYPPTSYGCGAAYWCYPPDGIPRWTPVYDAIGQHVDLAYSLWEPETAVPDSEPGGQAATWGRVKALYR